MLDVYRKSRDISDKHLHVISDKNIIITYRFVVFRENAQTHFPIRSVGSLFQLYSEKKI